MELVWISCYRSEIENQDLNFLIVFEIAEDYFDVCLELSLLKQ